MKKKKYKLWNHLLGSLMSIRAHITLGWEPVGHWLGTFSSYPLSYIEMTWNYITTKSQIPKSGDALVPYHQPLYPRVLQPGIYGAWDVIVRMLRVHCFIFSNVTSCKFLQAVLLSCKYTGRAVRQPGREFWICHSQGMWSWANSLGLYFLSAKRGIIIQLTRWWGVVRSGDLHLSGKSAYSGLAYLRLFLPYPWIKPTADQLVLKHLPLENSACKWPPAIHTLVVRRSLFLLDRVFGRIK